MLKFQQKLEDRMNRGSVRSLSLFSGAIDFFSNDYLGLSRQIEKQWMVPTGSSGSRLISGNSTEAETTETWMADFFESESALVFNSGYDANLGFFSSVPQRGDFIVYDELIHASVRDGIRLSNAQSFSFKHNDCADLIRKINRTTGTVFVAIESLYSMDGDIAPLAEIAEICTQKNALLVVDEAHACGIFGAKGKGLCSETGILKQTFARIITFGKAYGTHGAAVLGTSELKSYLINFARSFIYTTALPPYQYAHIQHQIEQSLRYENREQLQQNIQLFRKLMGTRISISDERSPIQVLLFPGIDHALSKATYLQNNHFAVKAILSPTVPEGQERLRICIHAFNTEAEITELAKLILQD